jgi:hypothetical protein
MSQILGSCAGSFSAQCLTSLLSPNTGDFRSGHQHLCPILDSSLVLFPFILSLLYPSSPHVIRFLDGFVISLFVIQGLVIAFPQEMYKRYYGIRFSIPLVFGIIYVALSVYYPTDPSPASAWYASLVGSVGLAFVTLICVSDIGFSVNALIRSQLESISDEVWMKRTMMIMLGAVSLLPIFFALRSELPFGYMHEVLLVGIIVLSISASRVQRGSIVSAAITVYSITCLHIGVLPMEIAVVFATLYNSFILNRSRKDTEMLPDLPLLDDSAIPSPMSESEFSNVRFKYVANNLVLASFFSQLDVHFESFFLVASITAMWILAAPHFLTNRHFPL